MKDVAKVVIAVLLVVFAWKLVKGLLGIVIIVAAIGLLIWGGMKLLEGRGQKRIK